MISGLTAFIFRAWFWLFKLKMSRHWVQIRIKGQVQNKSGIVDVYAPIDLISNCAQKRFSLIFESPGCLNAVWYYRTLEQSKWEEHDKSDKKFLRLLRLGLCEIATIKCLSILWIFSLSAGGEFSMEKLNSLETNSNKMWVVCNIVSKWIQVKLMTSG